MFEIWLAALAAASMAGCSGVLGWRLRRFRAQLAEQQALAQAERERADALQAQIAEAEAALDAARCQLEDAQGRRLSVEQQAQQQVDDIRRTAERIRSSMAVGREHLHEVDAGLQELLQIDKTFERWYSSMAQLLKHNADLHHKNEDFQQIVRQMTIVTLNATIEAARAGASGRGFAVVSEEMRSLAARAQELSREYSASLHENDLLTSAAFQDLQAGGKMLAGAVINLHLRNQNLMISLDAVEAG